MLTKKNYEDAIKSYQWILTKDESNLACICGIGHCNFLLKRFKEAEESYIKALRVASFSG
jgi:tetratricopeptide (TPR) repeat protein